MASPADGENANVVCIRFWRVSIHLTRPCGEDLLLRHLPVQHQMLTVVDETPVSHSAQKPHAIVN
jgi:hypothetical protein